MNKIYSLLKKHWLTVLIIISVLLVFLLIDICVCFQGKRVETASLFVLLITFGSIFWYTIETRRLREATEKTLYINERGVKLNNQNINDQRFYSLLSSFQNIFYSLDFYRSDLNLHMIADDALRNFIEYYRAEEALHLASHQDGEKQSRIITFNNFYKDNKSEYKNIQMLFNSFDAIILMLVKIKDINSNDYAVYKKHFQSLISNYTTPVLFYYGLSDYCSITSEIDKSEIFIGLVDASNIIKIEDLAFYK